MVELIRTVLRVKKVAATLDVDQSTVYKLIKSGELQGHRVGADIRVFADSVADYQTRSMLTSKGATLVQPVRKPRASTDHTKALDTLSRMGISTR